MCSGVGVATTFALGIVLLAHDGWRRAVRALCLPATAYLVWFMAAGRAGLAATGDSFGASVVLKVPTFVATNLKNDLGHTAGWHSCGAALAVVVLLWLLWRSPRLVRWNPSVLAGAAAAVVFYAMAAFGRDRINAALSPSRYAYVGVALLMPALALMLSAVWVFLGFAPERLGRHVPKSVPARRPVAAWPPGPFSRVRGQARRREQAGAARPGPTGTAEASGAPMPRSPWRHLRLAVLAVVVAGDGGKPGKRAAVCPEPHPVRHRSQGPDPDHGGAAPAAGADGAGGQPVPGVGERVRFRLRHTEVLSGLYRRHLLPRPAPASMTGDQVRATSHGWTCGRRVACLFGGPFRLMRTAGAEPSVRTAGAGWGVARDRGYQCLGHAEAWPSGPGLCELAGPPGPSAAQRRRAAERLLADERLVAAARMLPTDTEAGAWPPGSPGPPPWVRSAGDDSRVPSVILDLVPADGSEAGSRGFRLGAGGGRLRVSLARALGFPRPRRAKWHLERRRSSCRRAGTSGSATRVPGDGTDVRVPAGRSAEFPGSARGRLAPAVAR